MSTSDPASAGDPPPPFELHRAQAAEGKRSRLVVVALALVAVGLLLVAVVGSRGTSALTPGSLEVTPGVGMGSLHFGQATVADAERFLGKGHNGSVQRTSTQNFGPDGAGPKVHHAIAKMAYRGRGVALYFSAEVDESFDRGDPAHKERFERFRQLEQAPLSSVEVRGKDVATPRGLRVGDTLEAMLEKHGAPAWRHRTQRETHYLYPEGLTVEVKADGKVVKTLVVSPPIDTDALDKTWRRYEPNAAPR